MTTTTGKRPLAWVTGGATGIGFAAAQALGRAGYAVAVSGRRHDKIEEALSMLRADDIEAIGCPLDVADAQAVATAAARLQRERGAIEVLVASAGTNVPKRYWRDLKADDFARVTRINLEGVANGVCAVLPGMRAAGRGTIIVVSSWAGWRYLTFTGAAYGASKQALGPLVESINDQEGSHGIRATMVCPGEVATPILRARPSPPPEADIARMLKPEDVGDAIAYVAKAPAHVCINELVISPTWNRIYLGADDLVPVR
ncbi:MAG: SDR family NAD(P)-dependent oxidoreductase [Burkholderiaceae bacterium]